MKPSTILKKLLDSNWNIEIEKTEYETYACFINREGEFHQHIDRRWRKALAETYKETFKNPVFESRY